jgi:Cu/Ag efflux protein CusF
MTLNRSLALTLMLFGLTSALGAQKTVAVPGEKTTASVTIQQIDSTRRLVTYRTADGTEDTVYAGPEFARFNELKVGDKVNMTYYESKVYQLRKPGAPPLTPSDKMVATKGTGAAPAATLSRQTVQTVTVKTVDMNVPSITVTTSDGRTVTRKVDKKSYLEGVKAGDTIDIVSTEAILASVEHAK